MTSDSYDGTSFEFEKIPLSISGLRNNYPDASAGGPYDVGA